jgi:hypothetical protein
MKLDAGRFGVAFGTVYAALFGWGGAMAEMVGSFYSASARRSAAR